MIDRNLVSSGFDTETLVSEEYLSYVLLAQIEAGMLPTEFSIVDTDEDIDVDVILHPPNYGANRLYTPEPSVELPTPITGSFNFNLQSDEASPIAALAFSPDGTQITGGTWEGSLRYWDIEEGIYSNTFEGHGSSILALAYSPDGSRVVSSAINSSIVLTDPTNGSEVRRFQGHSGPVFGLAFSPDGARIASAGADKTIRIWDVQTGNELLTLIGHTLVVFSVKFSPDGSKLISGSLDKTVRTWNAINGTELSIFEDHNEVVADVAFSPDGLLIASASGDKTIKIWTEATGELLQSISGHESAVNCIAFSPDSMKIVSGSNDNTLRLWNVTDGEEEESYEGHSKPVLCADFHPDGQSIASGSIDKKIHIWNANDAVEIKILRVVFTHLLVFVTVTDNKTNETFPELPLILHLDLEIESSLTGSGLERNHQLGLSLVRLDPLVVTQLENNDIDPKAVENGIRENLDRSVPLGIAQGQQVQKIRMRKFVTDTQNSIGLYIDLALKSGSEADANLEPRGKIHLANDFRPPGSDLAFATSPSLLALLGPDLKFRQAEETEPDSGDFRFPLRKDPLDKSSDEVGKLKAINIRSEKSAGPNGPPIHTGRLEVDVHGEYTDLPFDPDFNLYLYFQPDIKEQRVDWDIDIDVSFGLLATLFLIVAGTALTLLFAPGLVWGSTLIVGTIIGLAVLKGFIGEPLAAKIIGGQLDEEKQASFLDALPFELPVASRRWDPFYITEHTIMSLTDEVVIDDQGISFESEGIRLNRRPVPIDHVVIRNEERTNEGVISGFQYRVLDFLRITDDLEALAPGTDRMAFSSGDSNGELLVTLTTEQILERIEAKRLLAPISFIPKRIHLVNNQIDDLLCISFREKEELRRDLIDQYKARTRTSLIDAIGGILRIALAEELELSLGRPPTEEELDKAFDKRLDELIALPVFIENLLPDELEDAIVQVLRFDLSPEEFVEHQLAKILVIDGKEIIVRHNQDGTETPYFRDRPDGDLKDNLLSLPHYSPPYEPPPS